jgi:hypothetical protein
MTKAEQAAFAVSQLDRYYRSPHPQAEEGQGDEESVTVVRKHPAGGVHAATRL